MSGLGHRIFNIISSQKITAEAQCFMTGKSNNQATDKIKVTDQFLSWKGLLMSNPSSIEYHTNPNPVSESSAQKLPGELCHAHHPLGQTLSPHSKSFPQALSLSPHSRAQSCPCQRCSQHVASPQPPLLWAEHIQGPQPPLVCHALLIFAVFLWMLSNTSSQGEATSAQSRVGQPLHSTAWHYLV